MYQRLSNLPINNSFFLFGPRGAGKSTLLRSLFPDETSLWVNLLNPKEEDRFARDPAELIAIADSLPDQIQHVVIDEIQKLPRLLDVVHLLIERPQITPAKIFVMTGSSARKLKHGGANLLAGRAFVYHLNALSYLELGADFDLLRAISFGLLPKVWLFHHDEERIKFLEAYALTYLKEEIWAEQIVRQLDPFRKFIEVAAQSNGKIINYANVARDVGVDDKTVKEYYSILEDTLIGHFLEAHQSSFRKRLAQKPKFYFFDTGVARSLARLLSVPLRPQTKAYGDAFEHFIIVECMKLAQYFRPDYRFSYLRTKDDAEIDLIVDRPGEASLLIEIKSAVNVSEESLSSFSRLVADFSDCEAICISDEVRAKRYGKITVMPWRDAIVNYFGRLDIDR